MSPGEDTFDTSPKTLENGRTPSSSRADRSEPPKRLRYWLIDMINSGEILGLQWLDNAHTIFRIPWKHAGKNNWKEEDCKIFQAWAEHRGKFKPGDKIEAATWKTRLRCALNKLPDIKELKEQSYLEGNEPFRVYKLLPEPEKAIDQEIYPRNTWGKESPPNRYNGSPNQYHPPSSCTASVDYGYQPPHQPPNLRYSPGISTCSPTMLPSPTLPHTTAPHNVPTSEFRQLQVNEAYHSPMPNGYPLNKAEVPPFDVNASTSPFLVRNPSESYGPYSPVAPAQHNVVLPPMGNVSPSGSNPISPAAGPHHLMDMDAATCAISAMEGPPVDVPDELPFPQIPPQMYEMEIYVRYRGHTVIAEHVSNKQGCRIHFGDTSLQLIAMATHELPSAVFGSESLRQIELVKCERYALSDKQVQLTKHVLDNIKRGLIIQYDDGCFYARRLCQSRVFITGPETGDTPEKLERDVKVKVFDSKKFWDQLQKYMAEGRLRTPEFELKASFGQSWSIKTPLEKNLVTVCMVPRAARYVLQKMREQHGPFVSLNDSLISNCGPDSYDQLAELATRQSVKGVDDFVQEMAHCDPDFITSVKPMAEAPVTSGQANVYTAQSGYFQRNTFRPAPIVPLASANDIEMNGLYAESAYSRR